jgi:hypothetical protein
VIWRLALRSLFAHPLRTAVLAGGFGLGVAVMVTLLGVGEVILAQVRAPALHGGGDVIVVGATGDVSWARYVLANVIGREPLRSRVRTAAPSSRSLLYLVREGRVVPLRAKAGIPSRERAIGDPETSTVAVWTDAPEDGRWTAARPGDLLRAMDRFHPVPDVPARAGSWAEWLYFNGRAGDARFYLTFMVGGLEAPGRRGAGVRLQLERRGRRTSYADGSSIDEAELLSRAPDLTLGASRVRLEGSRYVITLDLPKEGAPRGSRVRGELAIDASGQSMPPIVLRGAAGWQSGYVVPVMSGALSGELLVDGERVALDGGTGYHDHNWGFWDGVTWQWGQVQHGDLSIVYGRVHPPADAADPERVPGFLAALGPDGPLGYATGVRIEESNDPATGRPARVVVRGRGLALDLTLDLPVEEAVVTRMPQGAFGGGMDFLQMQGAWTVSGRAAGRELAFTAPGSAETFRGD